MLGALKEVINGKKIVYFIVVLQWQSLNFYHKKSSVKAAF
jgi:hypothetical protein